MRRIRSFRLFMDRLLTAEQGEKERRRAPRSGLPPLWCPLSAFYQCHYAHQRSGAFPVSGTPAISGSDGLLRSYSIQYSNYTDHYALDAFDMPLPEELGFFRRSQDRRRLETVIRMIPRHGVNRVLDVGAGTGWLAEMLARRGFTATALDLGHDSLVRAARRVRAIRADVRFAQGDVCRLPFPDASFDAVTACEVLEHLDRPGDALGEIARVLRPGGYAVLSTPYRERIEMTLCIHCNRKTPVNAHLHSFDKETIAGLFREAGLDPRAFSLFGNRSAERFGLAGFTSFLPHAAWRAADRLCCGLFGRQSFLAVRAVRNA